MLAIFGAVYTKTLIFFDVVTDSPISKGQSNVDCLARLAGALLSTC